MATLEKIRSKKVLLIVGAPLMLLFVVTFFLPHDFHLLFGNRNKEEKMIVIDGESFSHRVYHSMVDQMTKIQEKYSQRSLSGEEDAYRIRQNVYQMLVNAELIRKQAEKAGLVVTNEEVSDMFFGLNPDPFVQQYPAFTNPQTGRFDRSYLNYFTQKRDSIPGLREEWEFILTLAQQQRRQEKYETIISKALAPNSLDAEFNFDISKTSADFAYIVKHYASIADSTIAVSKKEIEALYKERKKRYKQPDETRAVKYITFDIAPSESDYQQAETSMSELRERFVNASTIEDIDYVVGEIPGNRFVNAFVSENSLAPQVKTFAESAGIGEVKGPFLDGDTYKMVKLVNRTVAPDSVKIRQIVFRPDDDEQSIAFMDSIMHLLVSGKSFTEVAPPLRQTGDSIWATEAMLIELGRNFADKCFSMPLHKIEKVKSDNYYHLLVVEARTRPVSKVKIAEIDNQVIASSRTRNDLYNEANRFATYNTTAEAFEKGAVENGYTVYPTVYLRANDLSIGNVKRSRSVVQWTFTNTGSEKVRLFECEDQYVVVAIESEIKAGFSPLSMIENELKAEILNDKKAAKIMEELKAKSATSLEAYAEALSLNIDTARFVSFTTGPIRGIGMEPALEALAPVAEMSKMSAPIKGNNGVYVINVFNQTINPMPFDANAQKDMMKRNYSYTVMRTLMRALQDKANIEDYRYLFY